MMNKLQVFGLIPAFFSSAFLIAQTDTAASRARGKMLRNKAHHVGEISLANYRVDENGDTVILNRLQPVEILTLRTYAHPREQEAYERVVAGVRRVWPLVREADSLWQAVRLQKDRSRDLEKVLRERLETHLKTLSRFEGAIFLKLLSRATGLTAYQLVKNLRGSLMASLYQKAARKADVDLKTRFDPQISDEDRRLEEVCRMLESGALAPLP